MWQPSWPIAKPNPQLEAGMLNEFDLEELTRIVREQGMAEVLGALSAIQEHNEDKPLHCPGCDGDHA